MTRVFSLVLPAYNPGAVTLAKTWHALDDFQESQPRPWEIVYVLDGCTDDSAALLNRLKRSTGARVRVIELPANRGKGHAVRVGMLAARGAWRLFTDIDLAYTFDDILKVAGAVAAGSPVAIASREHPESRVDLPNHYLPYAYRRHVQGHLFNGLARLLLPLAQRDTQAGLKGMSAAVAQQLIPSLECDGFGFDCELLTACAAAKVPVEELPVTVRFDDDASTTGWTTGFSMVGELRTIRRRWRRGHYPTSVTLAAEALPEPAGAALRSAA